MNNWDPQVRKLLRRLTDGRTASTSRVFVNIS